MKKKLAILTLLISSANISYAASTTSGISSASINEGVTKFETRVGFTNDNSSSSTDRQIKLREDIGHAFSDWYLLRLSLNQDKNRSKNLEHSSIIIDNRFQLIEKKDYGFDGAINVRYQHKDGDKKPNSGHINFILSGHIKENYSFVSNTIFTHDLGAQGRHGVGLDIRNKILKKLDYNNNAVKKVELGVEMLNDFGRLRDSEGYNSHNHQIGPILKTTFKNNVFVEVGYRSGISDDAPDHSFKLFVGRTF